MLESHLHTKADFGILLSTCPADSQVKRNELKIKQLKSDTYITKDLQGNRIPHPRPEILRGEVARRQYVSFLAEMGQTTASKSKVKKIAPNQVGGLKRLLG